MRKDPTAACGKPCCVSYIQDKVDQAAHTQELFEARQNSEGFCFLFFTAVCFNTAYCLAKKNLNKEPSQDAFYLLNHWKQVPKKNI